MTESQKQYIRPFRIQKRHTDKNRDSIYLSCTTENSPTNKKDDRVCCNLKQNTA